MFAAIDARQGRVKINHRSGITRPKFNAPELKKLLVDASEGVVSILLLSVLITRMRGKRKERVKADSFDVCFFHFSCLF